MNRFFTSALATTFLALSTACSDHGGGDDSGAKSDVAPSPTPTTTPVRTPCVRPDGAPTTLAKISDVIKLLNLLPKPVTAPCLLDVLPRPLDVTATKSRLSLQPANGDESPRIFVRLGGLVLAIVPDGEGAGLLEMSEFVSATKSVKGELVMPFADTMVGTAAYERIYREGKGSTCAACHSGETAQVGADYGAKAIQSTALRPLTESLVSLDGLRRFADECGNANNDRCDVLRSLLGKEPDDVREAPFPEELSTLF